MYIALQIFFLQNKCCSITIRTAVMCELNLATIQLITVKLLNIFHKNINIIHLQLYNQIKLYFFLQNKCCSITNRTAVMCKLNLATIQSITVKLLNFDHKNIKLYIFNCIIN